MASAISFFPVLNKKEILAVDCSIASLTFEYDNGSERTALKYSEEHDSGVKIISIQDDTGRWTPEKYNLRIKGRVVVNHPNKIYDAVGINRASLAYGVTWKSKSANKRGAMTIAPVINMPKSQEISFELAFQEASLRGNIELAIAVHTNETIDELPKGLVIGEIIQTNIVLEGINSTFAVFEKYAKGEPLWSVECEWDEPEYSQFSECVRVVINTAHPAWTLASDPEIRKELLKEIMASSMQIVISELEPEQYSETSEYQPGSVCDAIAYLTSRADINNASHADIAKSIRKYLDSTMK